MFGPRAHIINTRNCEEKAKNKPEQTRMSQQLTAYRKLLRPVIALALGVPVAVGPSGGPSRLSGRPGAGRRWRTCPAPSVVVTAVGISWCHLVSQHSKNGDYNRYMLSAGMLRAFSPNNADARTIGGRLATEIFREVSVWLHSTRHTPDTRYMATTRSVPASSPLACACPPPGCEYVPNITHDTAQHSKKEGNDGSAV
jgi:hypothetical protein